MILDRFERFRGHLPARIPIDFKCAECLGSLRHVALENNQDEILCYNNPKHGGLISFDDASRILYERSRGKQITAQEDLAKIARTESSVAIAMKARQRRGQIALFGEDE